MVPAKNIQAHSSQRDGEQEQLGVGSPQVGSISDQTSANCNDHQGRDCNGRKQAGEHPLPPGKPEIHCPPSPQVKAKYQGVHNRWYCKTSKQDEPKYTLEAVEAHG